MKSVTEFAYPLLQKVLAAKTTLTTEGKTPEEVSTAIGESFKLEGDKLKHILAASDLVVDKTAVRRVVVVSFAEGEPAPAKYQKVEEFHYLVDIVELTKFVPPSKSDRRGPKKGGREGAKSSPWGMTPEEKAAKNKSAAQPKS